MAVDRVLC